MPQEAQSDVRLALIQGFLLLTLCLALPNLLEPDAGVLGRVGNGQARPMLVLHTVRQVLVQLSDLVVPVLEELVPFDHEGVGLQLLHCDDLRELRVDRHRVKLRVAQLSLQIVVLLDQLVDVLALLLKLLVPDAQVVPQIVNDLHKLLFVFAAGHRSTASSPTTLLSSTGS